MSESAEDFQKELKEIVGSDETQLHKVERMHILNTRINERILEELDNINEKLKSIANKFAQETE